MLSQFKFLRVYSTSDTNIASTTQKVFEWHFKIFPLKEFQKLKFFLDTLLFDWSPLCRHTIEFIFHTPFWLCYLADRELMPCFHVCVIN